ncbi:TonB-linked outer membrane protein, SusC/RagA family [Pseudarcicella hirudinis]|uniref:TonB-linked outer membrane protein, SusC/RagA family n=1 Tax=Pseudarcicella hirudinis TaxID=1079859 RepID=A0A1I5XCK6_9BACT|nr:SusC/RagA family TonB-linked outer membrane protein [Pseudarcicella hirudinis]SFQ29709.1 TonB-linked outer membrane protein, SusC/RagA family [Pseudarcicella hirudinis]
MKKIRLLKTSRQLLLLSLVGSISLNGYSNVEKSTNSAFSTTAETLLTELKGKVTSAKDATPVVGASVFLKENPRIGTSTDVDGNFKLNVPENLEKGKLTLVISTVGFEKQEIALSSGQTQVDVTLKESLQVLSEVVVTALGVKRDKKALAYSVTEISGGEFTQARETNLANSLSGKIAGVNATSLATGAGGSSRVVIRGNGSLSGDNQPLYVINGMPIDNSTPGGSPTTGGGGQNVDRGDGIGGINPDDIESISVLKGGTAAALYGSRAANGVILITTKKGAVKKGIGIEYNSTATIDQVVDYTNWQYQYGQGDGGVKPTSQAQAISWGRRSWGAKMDGQPYISFDGLQHPYSPQKNNISNFYNTGTTFSNTVAFSGGNETTSFRASLADIDNKSILPNSTFNRKVANLSLSSKIGQRITIDALAQYNLEKAHNRPSAGDAPGNPNWSNYMIANTVDVRSLSPGYDANGREIQWNETPYASNSYFVVNRYTNDDTKNRFIGQFGIRYDILQNLFIKGNVSRDFSNYNYVGIIPTGTVYTTNAAGEYQGIKSAVSETNSLLTLNYNTKLRSLQVNAMFGGNQRNFTREEIYTNGTQYIIPFFYSFTNLATATTRPATQRLATNSLFGSLDLDYKGILFLNASARQDWFSTLGIKNNTILYPALGSSFILSQAVELPSVINYAKLRASWAQVGGGVPDPYTLNQTYSMVTSSGQPLQQITTTNGEYLLNNPNLKPFTSTTYEAGLDAKLFNNKLGVDLTYYLRRTTDDIVKTAISGTSGYQYSYVNVGQVDNQGIELLLTGSLLKTKNFSWDASYNFAYNQNKVVKLADGVNTIQLATSVGSWAYVNTDIGQPYGIIKGYTMVKDAKGNIVYDTSTGYPMKSGLTQIGQGVAPYTMGLSNKFNYKNFSLDILLDGKFGNEVFSVMNVYATRFGLQQSTLAGRETGLALSGVTASGDSYSNNIPVANLRLYYDNLKNYSNLFIYDGSFIKLRQIIFSYRIPSNFLKFAKIQSASISFVARNLFTLYKKTENFDPESSYTNSNAQGFEAFGLPRTRSFGLNLSVKF